MKALGLAGEWGEGERGDWGNESSLQWCWHLDPPTRGTFKVHLARVLGQLVHTSFHQERLEQVILVVPQPGYTQSLGPAHQEELGTCWKRFLAGAGCNVARDRKEGILLACLGGTFTYAQVWRICIPSFGCGRWRIFWNTWKKQELTCILAVCSSLVSQAVKRGDLMIFFFSNDVFYQHFVVFYHVSKTIQIHTL